jgi:phosphoglycolate phosphatase-like HAD superfamily hydrolase
MNLPALFLGDSKYDYRSSTHNGMDFIFVSDWTEVPDWNEFCKDYDIKSIGNLSDLVTIIRPETA